MARLSKYKLEKYQFGSDVQKGKQLYGMSGKLIFQGRWISKSPEKIIIIEMNETITDREAEFYLEVNDHNHIINTIGLIENTSNLVIFIQEFARWHDLGSVLMNNHPTISLEILKEMFVQIADAMSYVASKRIVHGDLGCRNVLVFHVDASEPRKSLVKITDLGLARWMDRPTANADPTIVPIRYCAPEILPGEYDASYSEKSDAYSMGVLMWEALSRGQRPYWDISDDEVITMKKGNGKLEEPAVSHPDLWELMNECWRIEPDQRPTFNEIKRTLSMIEISTQLNDQTTAVPRRTRIHCDYKLGVDVRIKDKLNKRSQSVFEAEWISDKGKPSAVLIKRKQDPSAHEQSIYSAFKDHPHPNIIHTFGLVKDDTDGSVMILQEHARYGDLQFLLGSGQFQPSPTVLVSIFLQIIDAMIAIVERGFVHGDLRCENILVFEMHPTDPKQNLVKLTNFTMAHPKINLPDDNTRVNVSVRYCAPEILRRAGRSNYPEWSDMYSMGVLMWQAYSQGKRPYDSSDIDAEVLQRRLNGEELPKPNHCNDQVWQIIDYCWMENPESRFDFEGIKTLLSRVNPDSIDLVNCKHCNKGIATNEMENHRKLCPSKRRDEPEQSKRRVYNTRCNFCGERCSESELDEHQRSCSLNPLSPTYTRHPDKLSTSCEFCGKRFEDTEIEHHMDTCPSRRIPPLIHKPGRTIRCEYCDKEYPDDETADHMKSCRQKSPKPDPQAECTYCQHKYPQTKINEHEKLCPSRPKPRDLSPPKPTPKMNCRYCTHQYTLVDIERHEKACPSKPRPPPPAEPAPQVECTYCHRKYQIQNIDRHERSCPSKSVPHRHQPPRTPRVPQTSCVYCKQQYPSATIGTHQASCLERPKSCTEQLFSWFCCCCSTH